MESSSTHPQTVEAVASEIIVPSITFYCYEGTLRVNTLCKILITPDVITAQVFPYSFYNWAFLHVDKLEHSLVTAGLIFTTIWVEIQVSYWFTHSKSLKKDKKHDKLLEKLLNIVMGLDGR